MSAETITKLVPLFQIHSTSGRVPAQEWHRLPTSLHADSGDLGCPATATRIYGQERDAAGGRDDSCYQSNRRLKRRQTNLQAHKAFHKVLLIVKT